MKKRKSTEKNLENAIKGELYSVERLEEYAKYLARQLIVTVTPGDSQTLLPRLRDNGRTLLACYRELTQALHRKESLSPAGDWLTDNFHIVEDQLRVAREDLPPTFYRELPKIAGGELAGYPRIYAMALALIAHTDSQLESATINRFVMAYQSVSALTIGELWALAITLRLVLIENLRRIVVRITLDHQKRNAANIFADQLYDAIGDEVAFQLLLAQIPANTQPGPQGDCSYISQIAKRLRDQEPELWPALEVFEKILQKKQLSVEQVVDRSHQMQAANQLTVANIITSMRLLTNLDWREFFESVSLVDRVLATDPVYLKMDFLTRDDYRHVIERISKRSGRSEMEIAERAIQLARGAHVGNYLLGDGRIELEGKSGARFSFSVFARRRPLLVYFGLFGVLLAGALCGLRLLAQSQGADRTVEILILALALIPVSELVLQLINLLLTRLIAPKILPKLDFSNGIPLVGRTIVVIPCLLTGASVVADLLEKLEIHFLGNSDPQIFFALLSDFKDAKTESTAEDDDLLRLAHEGINRLNLKYPSLESPRFCLFHRVRLWNTSEKHWMGWERKRGKIQEFNRLLRGAQDTSFQPHLIGQEFLQSIKYVLTLDADTQLPRESARKLVGAILHPLNQARFDSRSGRVVQGYGVLQPRIGISIESSSRSLFAKTFSGFTGLDPYTTAVSDIYQDLFSEGSYVGKGLYDVDAFEAATENRIPENQVLSHDLFEGLFARAGLVTDVELLDDYPTSYLEFFTRQHRWTRGDWQLLGWIFPFVQTRDHKRVRNSLPLISRWKIFDNLRRSLVAPALLLWFVLSVMVFPGSLAPWISLGFIVLAFPLLVQAIDVMNRCMLWVVRRFFFLPTRPIERTRADFLQVLFYFTSLVHHSLIQIDAIFRALYRMWFSKTKRLEWTTAAQVRVLSDCPKPALWQKNWPFEVLLVAFAAGTLTLNLNSKLTPSRLQLILFFTVIWMSYPILAKLVSKKTRRPIEKASRPAQLLLRQIARRTWRYFEKHVVAGDHWLPPDNHQEIPLAVTAHRTSPTNLGLYLLAIFSARDFGYISLTSCVQRLERCLSSMKKLELYRGHFLNWYDTQSLAPLEPRYVSTVDSGNLAGYLLTARQASFELLNSRVFGSEFFKGVRDIAELLDSDDLRNLVDHLIVPENRLSHWVSLVNSMAAQTENMTSGMRTPESEIWRESLVMQIADAASCLSKIWPWQKEDIIEIESLLGDLGLQNLTSKWQEMVFSLDQNLKLKELIGNSNQDQLRIEEIVLQAEQAGGTDHLLAKLMKFSSLLLQRQTSLNAVNVQINDAAEYMEQKFTEMNFGFLLDAERGIFSIGFSLNESRLDRGSYDLLGSEARLASFVAIAKGDVAQKHWFRLGRQLVPTSSGRALISWSASMFEYLLPSLVMRTYENTLLEETGHTVVATQILYGKTHGVPWGISEAGYNARDLQLNYQYGPFGIPGLGLKRGLSHELVIAPYATLLAAMVDSKAAIENLERLIELKMLTTCGFYESIDYTAERLPEHQTSAIIRSFMAHHQAMSLLAIANVVHGNLMPARFHNDPRVRATRLLLQERIPQGVVAVLPKATEVELETLNSASENSFVRHYSTPTESSPRIQLLSNRDYSIMISTAGAGYSRCGGLAVTRWREDATLDNCGNFIFIRDVSLGMTWSTSFQPLATAGDFYKVTFGEDKAEFRRRDGEISTYTQILVAPEDNVEIRHVTLSNHSGEDRVIELTSYLEPVLGSVAADLDHLAFSKLFIQSEYLESKKALLAKRRKRSVTEKENWGLHVVVTDGELLGDVQYETDRALFLGRGRDLANALALTVNERLSNTAGATLDPIFSLRVRIQVPAGENRQIAFATGMTDSHDRALELVDRYHDIHSFERESKLAWIKSQADLLHLSIDAETCLIYQRLAERILYAEPSLRVPIDQRATKTNVQSSLWPSGISGDLPMMVVRIADHRNIGTIRKLLHCHEYLRLKGLVYEFIVINDHEMSYYQELQEELLQLIRTTGSQSWLNRAGGIYLLRRGLTPEKDLAHIQAVARVFLAADQPLNEQINRKVIDDRYPRQRLFFAPPFQLKSTVQPALQLSFFNGYGGFADQGRQYVIQLGRGDWTPAPWINVVGNRLGFGFQISESGAGFTWAVNSQSNRLTPWSNDPISDPPGEIIYLRDEESGEIWTPTPLPIRSSSNYTIRHGAGFTSFELTAYGIRHELTVFAAIDEAIKISILKLTNLTGKRRRLSITSYTEWVLGSQRDKTSPFLICEIDAESGAVFARNPHDNEFANRISFADISQRARTVTCSRKEFLGRNGRYDSPEALSREGFSQRGGTGQDPCAALQVALVIDAGGSQETAILLGQVDSREEARALCGRFRDLDVAKNELSKVRKSWLDRLERVQVKTPEPAMNVMMNGWLLYQTLSCRYWSRTALYQSGGAYGFRDQLQDCMAFVYSAPELAREHILRAAARQFREGDVQHWWHPPTGRGVRTRISDDLLWLPLVVCFYVKVTGDLELLDEVVKFLDAPKLRDEEEDSYREPGVSTEAGSIFEHCLRAIQRSLAVGEHGLPLMGTGDWNDGMNRVGHHGRGESIWLGWFLYHVLEQMLPYCERENHVGLREQYQAHMALLKTALEKSGWDGEWYKRAYFDDASALGSRLNQECQIDSIAQSWSVISGAAEPGRSQIAMREVRERLIKNDLVLLFSPPFDQSAVDPGYIKGYLPGVRENGGQYTHAANWVVKALAELREGSAALDVFRMLNPILHSQTNQDANVYKIEPYVMAGDIYSGQKLEGRGGWSWYTGASAWYYRVGLESILGFQIEGNRLYLDPCIASSWPEYEIKYRYGASLYHFRIQNPNGLSSGFMTLNDAGVWRDAGIIHLIDDGLTHTITLVLSATSRDFVGPLLCNGPTTP